VGGNPPAPVQPPPTRVRADWIPLLDDPVFFEPFTPFFDPTIGRPSIPIETYLRIIFIGFRYRLGFETLCAEVRDSIAWRRFCRIGITDSVPHPTTLMKITTRCGDRAVDQLNEALLNKAMAVHVVKLDKVRADTTVVPANIAYPTDSGLLAKGVAKLTKTVAALDALGLARRTRVPALHSIGPPSCPSDRRLAAPAQRRRQRRCTRTDRRAGHHRRGRHQRRPVRGHKRPSKPSPCG